MTIEAAKRIFSICHWNDHLAYGVESVAQFYLDMHDETPVTEEWFRSRLGIGDDSDAWIEVNDNLLVEFRPGNVNRQPMVQLFSSARKLKEFNTRGEINTLVCLFGLKGTP